MGTVHGLRWNRNRESGSQSSVHCVLVVPDWQLRILWRVLSNNNNNNNSGNSLSISNNNRGGKDDILTHYIAPYIRYRRRESLRGTKRLGTMLGKCQLHTAVHRFSLHIQVRFPKNSIVYRDKGVYCIIIIGEVNLTFPKIVYRDEGTY